MAQAVVEAWRGDAIESRHRVHVAVVGAGGALRAWAGDPSLVTYARSAVKPFQALPLVEDGAAARFGFGPAELALACASHSGEARHIAIVRSMLRKIGADETALACGAQVPFHEPSARALRERGEEPARIHNNCSGKHAGMLALAQFHGWPLIGYHERGSPVQERMLREVSHWTQHQPEEIGVAVDGCGVSTFAVQLDRLAGAFAMLAAAARRGAAAPAAVVLAMVEYPELVGGSGRLCTQLMRTAAGRIYTKVGAEGVYCAGVPGAELGIALKVEDGAARAAEPALVAVLRLLGLLTPDEIASLDRWTQPYIVNTRGERVGTLRASIELETQRG